MCAQCWLVQIKQEGDELRITVELMDVQGNRSIWGATYQRKTADIQTCPKRDRQKRFRKTAPEIDRSRSDPTG